MAQNNFIKIGTDLKLFKALSLEEQADFVLSMPKTPENFISYICTSTEVLDYLREKALNSTYVFSLLALEIQDAIIYSSLNIIEGFPDMKKRSFISCVKNENTYEYLFNKLNLIDTLDKINPNDILIFLCGVKSFQIFKDIYHKPEVFKKLMEKTQLLDKNETYFYASFHSLPILYQEYVLKDLKGQKEYEEQYNAMYKEARKEAKKALLDKLPEDFAGQINYYALTDDNKAKDAFMLNLHDASISENEFSSFVIMYPKKISLNDISLIIKSTSIENIVQNKRALEVCLNVPELKDRINRKIMSLPVIPYDVLDKLFFFCTPSQKKLLLNKVALVNLLEHLDIPEVKSYILSKIEADNTCLKNVINVSSNNIWWPHIKYEYAKDILTYLDPRAEIHYLPPSEMSLIKLKIEVNPFLVAFVNEEVMVYLVEAADDDSSIFTSLPLAGLASIIKNPLVSNKKAQIIEAFFSKITTEILNAKGVNNIYNELTFDEKLKFIIEAFPPYLLTAYVEEENGYIKEAIAQMIILKQNSCFDGNYLDFILAFNKVGDTYYANVANDLSDENIIKLFALKPVRILENIIMNRFNHNPYFFNDAAEIDEVIGLLSPLNKREVLYKRQDMEFDIGEEDERLYNVIAKVNSFVTFRFIKSYHEGLFKDKKIYDAFTYLAINDPLTMVTLNYGILCPEFINLNKNFLLKIVKYPSLQDRLLQLKKQDKFSTLYKILKLINLDEEKIFHRKLLIILNYFENNEVNCEDNISKEKLNSLLNYIYSSAKMYRISSIDSTNDYLNYNDNLISVCDEMVNKAPNIYQLKDAIFKRYFAFSYEDSLIFLNTYNNNLEALELEDSILDFVHLVEEITTLDSADALKKIYHSLLETFDNNDLFIIEGELQKAFAKNIKDSLYRKTKTNRRILISGRPVNVIALNSDFKLIIHSTNAYNVMPMIENNYYKSWTKSKGLSNEGVYTSLVSNYSLGIPPLKEGIDGCLFAFNEFSPYSLCNMAPYDLVTFNNGYGLDTNQISKFLTADDMLAMTRHTHNELVLERGIMPNYVVITSNMSDKQKENAWKASKEMNDGKGIPILYLDFEEIVTYTKNEIKDLLKIFYQTKELCVFKRALSMYESMRTTLLNTKEYDFITAQKFDNYITGYIDYAISMPLAKKIGALLELKEIIIEEKNKFDLVASFDKKHKKFDIDYGKHLNNIERMLSFLNPEHDKPRLDNFIEKFASQNNLHIIRVLMLLVKLTELLNLSKEDLDLLTYASLKAHNNSLSKEDNNKVLAIKQCLKIFVLKEQTDIFNKLQIKKNERERLKKLCLIFKDANTLDNVRFTNMENSFREKSLILAESKILVPYAKKLYQMTKDYKGE